MTRNKFNNNAGIGRRELLKLTATTAGAAMLGLAAPAIAQAPRTIRFGSPQPAASLYNQAIVMFAEEAARLSDGAITVDIFPGSELGGVAEMLSSVQAGSLGMTIAVPAWYSNYVREMDLFTLPYLVSSQDRLKAALESAIGDKVVELSESAGFRMVGYWLMGGRHIANKERPIHTPDELAGLKIRVINSQVYLQAFRALGANPVALDPAELYLALQQGVVDGFAYPLPDILDAKLHEVSGFVSLDSHVIDFFAVSMNKAMWDGMSTEEQEIIGQAMRTSMEWQWGEQPKVIDSALEQLRNRVAVNDMTPENRQKFIDLTRPIYGNFEDSIGAELLGTAIAEFT